MNESKTETDSRFADAVLGLKRGDFSRLDPLFREDSSSDGKTCKIIEWYEKGYFGDELGALNEALACACFNGRTSVADYLIKRGVDPLAGFGTGMNGFHWAANRGQLETVKLLIERKVPLEVQNMYSGTVLGCTVWSAVHEPRADHAAIVEVLLLAGAKVEAAEYPTGSARLDEVLRRYGARA
jgi:Ankyrin repeats (3 copies)